jgi:Winged helix DNA-binding domain
VDRRPGRAPRPLGEAGLAARLRGDRGRGRRDPRRRARGAGGRAAHAGAARRRRRSTAATREAYARWLGTPSAAHAGRLLARLGDEVEETELEGDRVWALAADLDELRDAEPEEVVRLLPAFDAHVVAAPRDAAAVLGPTLRERVYRPQGWLSPVLLVDGRMMGVWRHEVAHGSVDVEIEPFGRLRKGARAAAEAEAQRLATFLDGELRLSWATP